MTVTASAPAARPGSTRPDLGRLLFVPACVLLLGVNVARLLALAVGDLRATPSAVALGVGNLLTLGFYALVIRCYLRRPRALASSSSTAVNGAAVVATALPLAVPLLHGVTESTALVAAGDALLLAGLAWSVWGLATLGRSFSVIPQARAVVSTGPYRFVRHPLYLGEIVATLGLATLRPSLPTYAAWALLCALQLYRSVHEERLLAAALDGYADYRRRTRRLVPGLL